jgi:hypothetical protein
MFELIFAALVSGGVLYSIKNKEPEAIPETVVVNRGHIVPGSNSGVFLISTHEFKPTPKTFAQGVQFSYPQTSIFSGEHYGENDGGIHSKYNHEDVEDSPLVACLDSTSHVFLLSENLELTEEQKERVSEFLLKNLDCGFDKVTVSGVGNDQDGNENVTASIVASFIKSESDAWTIEKDFLHNASNPLQIEIKSGFSDGNTRNFK